MPRNIGIGGTVGTKGKRKTSSNAESQNFLQYINPETDYDLNYSLEFKKKRKPSKFTRKAKKIIKKTHLNILFAIFGYIIERFFIFAFKGKRDSHKLKSVNIRNTNIFYRVYVFIKHYLKVTFVVITGIFRLIMPIVIPLSGVFIICFSIWSLNTYAIALEITMGNDKIAYVKNQDEFEDINNMVTDQVMKQADGEYAMESMPILQFTLVPKNEITEKTEIYNTLYTKVQEYLGQSWGFFIDGEIIGTSKNETVFTILQQELLVPYLSGDKTEKHEIINSIEMNKDTYSRSYEKDYDELKALFTSSATPVKHTVRKNESLEEIAKMYNISVPVIVLMNEGLNPEYVAAGTVLNVGKPYKELTVQTTRYITYNEVIPYSTKRTNTDSLYENSTEIKQKGFNGSNEVIAEVREVNGIETSRVAISTKRIKDPIAQQILVGTKTIAPSGKFIWPLEANKNASVSSPFGPRTLYGRRDTHRGVDLAGTGYGAEIYASDGGVVVEAGWDRNGLGNYIRIDHGNGIETYYGHCSKIAKGIKSGVKVYQGQLIAYVGSTGNSTGNHLHFAIFDQSADKFI
ncbi:MAG: Peptidase, partial [Clostridia bacterium]|nr:Peptidase [Clostridia bacterium]